MHSHIHNPKEFAVAAHRSAAQAPRPTQREERGDAEGDPSRDGLGLDPEGDPGHDDGDGGGDVGVEQVIAQATPQVEHHSQTREIACRESMG